MCIDICGLLCVNKTNVCGFYRVMLLMYFRKGNGFHPEGHLRSVLSEPQTRLALVSATAKYEIKIN